MNLNFNSQLIELLIKPQIVAKLNDQSYFWDIGRPYCRRLLLAIFAYPSQAKPSQAKPSQAKPIHPRCHSTSNVATFWPDFPLKSPKNPSVMTLLPVKCPRVGSLPLLRPQAPRPQLLRPQLPLPPPRYPPWLCTCRQDNL